MRRRVNRGNAALIAILIALGIVVIVLGTRQFVRATTDEAWVAAKPISQGEVITRASLTRTRVSNADGAVSDPRALLGRRAASDMAEGDVFTGNAVQPVRQSPLAARIPEGRVLYTLNVPSNAIPYSQLTQGDRIDVVARAPGGKVYTAATNVVLVGTANRPQGQNQSPSGRGLLTALAAPPGGNDDGIDTLPVLLAVEPWSLHNLAHVSKGYDLSLVVHSANRADDAPPLNITPPPRNRQIEVVEGLERKQVVVKL